MIAKEVAKDDLNRFVEAYRIDPIKRKKMQSLLDECVELIENEMASVNTDGNIEYTLLEPVVDDAGIVKCDILKFKNRRIRVEEMLKLDQKPEREKVAEMLTLMTGVNPAYVNKFSVDDLGYLNRIVLLFLPLHQ